MLIRGSGLGTVICVDNRSLDVLWATATCGHSTPALEVSRHVDRGIMCGGRSNDSVSWQRYFMDHLLSLVAGGPFVVNRN